MKKLITLVLVVIFGVLFTGCNNRSMNYIIEHEANIIGIVKETTDNSILVENETGQYWVSLEVENKDSVTHFNIGDEVVVYYDGNIAESYPMQINTVYAITLRTPAARTTVSGSFTVNVRDVIPDYCFDDTTPNVAVVTEFQSYPFTIFVGEEIGKQLEVGKNYVFTIKPIIVDETKEYLKGMYLSSLVWELPEFEITEFRLANEDELGLDSLRLTIE